MKKVYCIGEMLIDFVAENQGKDLTKAHTFTKKAGGAPANVAAAIAKLGGDAYFVGAVGNDPFGAFLIQTIAQLKVNTNFVQQCHTNFTTLAFVSLAEDGERDFIFSRGADKELTFDDEVAQSFAHQIIHFGAATSFLGGHLEKAYEAYLEKAVAQNAFISFDPNHRPDLWKSNASHFIDQSKNFIRKADFTKFSLEEALLISGEKDMESACKALHNLGAKLVAITLGKDGTYISTKGATHQVNSIAITPLDTTGAGDAFVGCFLKQVSQLANPKEDILNTDLLLQMIKRANIAGAVTAMQYGAIASLPTETQIDDLIVTYLP
ncbi:carbohydrate kinase [Zhouia sp. PK063]|uniref:carbohydrate kinase n=1 Tax=Zhouia sp. PK063 TaxID=3373602 RepID=UPI00379992E0